MLHANSHRHAESIFPFHAYTFSQVAGADPSPASYFAWYDGSKSGAYSSHYEVKLLALTLLNYGESVVDGKKTAMSLMQRVKANSIEYSGYNAPWQPPVSWNREGQGIVDNAKGHADRGNFSSWERLVLATH